MTYQKRGGSLSPDRISAPSRSEGPARAVAPRASRARLKQSHPPQSRKPSRANPLAALIPLVILSGFVSGGAIAWVSTQSDDRISQWFAQAALPSFTVDRFEAKLTRLTPDNTTSNPEPAQSSPYALDPSVSLSFVPSIMYHDVVGYRKQVWFDTTTAELRQHFEMIKEAGVTPISIDDLYNHLASGDPLPDKAILLTFDDAYLGQYEQAYPLLKEYNYPAAFFVQTGFVGVKTSKDHFTWEQMREMEQEGLVTIAAHTINHPPDLRELDPDRLQRELEESKQKLEAELGREVPYFAYPTGYRDERVMEAVEAAGYRMAFTMDKGFTGQSSNLLEVKRFNQFKLTEALLGAQTLNRSTPPTYDLKVDTPLDVKKEVIDRVQMTTIRGGRPATVHADQRYNVGTLMKRYQAPAGINGSFFSIPWINSSSNVMIGPVMSANTRTFVPGREEDNEAIRGRPLVLFNGHEISFIPYDPDTMNQLEGIQAIMPDVTDLFVAGAWLVKDGQPLSRAQLNSFNLTSAAEYRPRAFFGIDVEGQVVLGTTATHIDATILAQLLPETDIQEAILLDSGFSTSLVYKDEILATGHASASQPSRPVPHAILTYDLPELWASEDQPEANQPVDKLELLIDQIPEAYQSATRQTLNAVLAGRLVLNRGDRGPAVTAVQLALGRLARSRGQYDLMPSGPDGVYGTEVSTALAILGFGADPLPQTTRDSPSQPVASLTRTTSGTQVTDPQPTPSITPIQTIDGILLQRVLDSFSVAPPSVLVDQHVTRQFTDLNQKPTRKMTQQVRAIDSDQTLLN